MPDSANSDNRKRTLVIEFELPTMHVDDMPELLAEFGFPGETSGENILRDIGEISTGLLTVEAMGEKDSEIVRVPVIALDARIEERPPTEEKTYKVTTDDLAYKVDEPHEEARVLGAMDLAELRVYERVLRTLRDEYTGQVSELAAGALQEARLASDEAEKRESERSAVFG